jgi:hypothetical protein
MNAAAVEELFQLAFLERFCKMLWEPLLAAGWDFGGPRYLKGDLASFDDEAEEIYIQDDDDASLEDRAKWLNRGMKLVYEAHPEIRLRFLAGYLESMARHKPVVDSIKILSVIVDISRTLAQVIEDPGARVLEDLLQILAGRPLSAAGLSGPGPGAEKYFIGRRSFYEGVEHGGLLPTGLKPELLRRGGAGDELERFFRAAAQGFLAARRGGSYDGYADAVEREGAGFGEDIAREHEALRFPGAQLKARLHDPKIPVPFGPSFQDEKNHKKKP